MENTPKANRLHIGIFGRCNSGKSSLANALAGRQAALVSNTPGTTTDPVVIPIELRGIGAAVIIDTAGFDDAGALGAMRLAATRRAAAKSDVAIVVFGGEPAAELTAEVEWITTFRELGIPIIAVVNPHLSSSNQAAAIGSVAGLDPLIVNAATGEGLTTLLEALATAAGQAAAEIPITDGLIHAGEMAVLVMPQDAAAPKGRLILPQAQTIRELLDKGCTAICCTPDRLTQTLAALSAPPALIVTDSQAFAQVSRTAPQGVPLTSFSILFAHRKGDLDTFRKGAEAIGRLTEQARVLIAEACTHAPASEDIGRVKLPQMLRAVAGEGLQVEVVSGDDFPDQLARYDLVIHCGACMFNRRHVLNRIAQATRQGVPITNYGIALAYLTGVLDKVVFPFSK